MLTRYRVAAWVTGVMLLVLTFVAVPLNYGWYGPRVPEVSDVVSPVHGFLYVVYIGVTLQLALARRWTPVRTVLLLLAGTVPFASFFAEHAVVRSERETAPV